MRKSFVPTSFIPPKKTFLGKYYIIPIETKDTNEDWNILINNADAIARQRGAGSRKEWPYNCTLEENYKNLAWLEQCALYKQLFCYIVRDKKDNSYIGALYIYPIELFFPQEASDYDVDFSFWIIQSEYDKNKYQAIYKYLVDWLEKAWPFKKERIFLRNKLPLKC